MNIEAPKWTKGAVPTTRGWMQGKELVKAMKISQVDIDAWHDARKPKPKAKAKAPKKAPVNIEPVGGPNITEAPKIEPVVVTPEQLDSAQDI
jgi:hypothetical protein